MNVDEPLTMLGNMSAATFMKRYWHKKPLLVRQAFPGFQPPVLRADVMRLAQMPEVQSRLVAQSADASNSAWKLSNGPFTRRALPPFKQAGWTLLVQGVDLHDDGIHALMQKFRFVPDARLDDVMVSYATDGGGVGPHFDSYDVFLLQAVGQRRWRIGRQKDLRLQAGVPLKILENFEPEQEFVLNPGDMLYLPPRYAHDGVAVGECMTYSIGFRSPRQSELVQELLQGMAQTDGDDDKPVFYRDPGQGAVVQSALIPQSLVEFASKAVHDVLSDPKNLRRALGEQLSEPKPNVWFERRDEAELTGSICLDRQTRMLYDEDHVFINGESFDARGRDAKLMQVLANTRALNQAEVGRLSASAQDLVLEWMTAGWLHADK
jgi:50S ribosomal protein L16 3-hydroxylase